MFNLGILNSLILKTLFVSKKEEDQDPERDINLACAALLCEAASMDGSYDEEEKKIIIKLIKKQFDLDARPYSVGQQIFPGGLPPPLDPGPAPPRSTVYELMHCR